MTGHIERKNGEFSDADLRGLLQRHVPRPPSMRLDALKAQILTHIDALAAAADMDMPIWIIGNQVWLRRGAITAALLLLVLGFTAGRNVADSILSADAPISYVFASETPWPDFMTLSSQEKADETAE